MPNQIKRMLVVCVSVVLVAQCAWFHKDAIEPEIIKPKPVDGYEALGERIHFPRSIREQGIEGNVVVSAMISTEGIVSETRITQSLHPELDQIVSNAIKRTPFTPALIKNTPAEVWISIPFVFALSEWDQKEAPFSSFAMIIKPSPSYETYEVEMKGRLKENIKPPLRLECLLPLNADKPWIRVAGKKSLDHRLFQDENGDWLVFNGTDQNLSWGFTYKPLDQSDLKRFRYQFVLNQALPEWGLVVIYGNQKVQFTQEPDRIVQQDDGDTRFEYELNRMDAYESRYLELELQTQITADKHD